MSMPKGENIQEGAADNLPNNGGVNAEEEIEESEECVSIFEEAEGKHVDALKHETQNRAGTFSPGCHPRLRKIIHLNE